MTPQEKNKIKMLMGLKANKAKQGKDRNKERKNIMKKKRKKNEMLGYTFDCLVNQEF